jgi:hypothetical protein
VRYETIRKGIEKGWLGGQSRFTTHFLIHKTLDHTPSSISSTVLQGISEPQLPSSCADIKCPIPGYLQAEGDAPLIHSPTPERTQRETLQTSGLEATVVISKRKREDSSPYQASSMSIVKEERSPTGIATGEDKDNRIKRPEARATCLYCSRCSFSETHCTFT